MSVKPVKKKYLTKKSSSTIESPLFPPGTDFKGGTYTQEDSLLDQGPGQSSVMIVTPSKPQESEKSEKGLKYDQDKPALAYIPKEALYHEGLAFSYGAKKYDAWNYKHGLSVSRALSASLRHIVQFLSGEDTDSESGVHHLGCARANLAMALDTLANHPKFDDRFKGGKK